MHIKRAYAQFKKSYLSAAAHRNRRGDRKPGGGDTQKYRLGSVFAVLSPNFEDLDDLAILGLFKDSSVALELLARHVSGPGGSLIDLIMRALSD